MKKAVFALTVVAALMLSLAGCGKVSTAEDNGQAAPSENSEPETYTGRQNGERFEATIILEGMEEPVRYEHIRNDTLGFEMDYDYESFARYTDAYHERFVSVWDDPGNPEDYLELRYDTGNAELVADAISAALSNKYDVLRDSRELDRAGSCICLEASVLKNTNQMADHLQEVYIIPAPDGCRVATAHCHITAAEGFSRRFAYMMNTLSVIDSHSEGKLSGIWQTASMGYEADGTMQPEYYVRFTSSVILYGHMKDGEFVPDHGDKIIRLEETGAGGTKIQAEASNGVQYTYQTAENDDSVLEYYETWEESVFPEMYRGGASLSRSG